MFLFVVVVVTVVVHVIVAVAGVLCLFICVVIDAGIRMLISYLSKVRPGSSQ